MYTRVNHLYNMKFLSLILFVMQKGSTAPSRIVSLLRDAVLKLADEMVLSSLSFLDGRVDASSGWKSFNFKKLPKE